MAKQTVKLYEALLQSVAALEGAPQGLEGIASARQGQQQQQHHHKAHNLINDIRSLKVLPKNTWKKLLGELQVPKRLGMLCCSTSSQLSLRQLAAVSALDAVISQAAKSDWYKTHAETDASSLVRQFALQLQQSGLLQQLPGLLSTAAAQLDAVQDKARMLASTQLSMQDGLAQAWPELPLIILLQEFTKQLLHITHHLEALLPVGSTARAGAVPPEVCFAAQRLQLAAVAHTCRCLEQLPDDTTPGLFFEGPFHTAVNHLGSANLVYGAKFRSPAGTSDSYPVHPQAQTPQQQQLLQQLQATCTVLLLALCQVHCHKHSRRLHQCSSHQEYHKHSCTIWQYACTHHSQLPQPFLQLCQTLGYSSRASLFLACSHPVYSRASGRLSLLFESLGSDLRLLATRLQHLQGTHQQLEQVQQFMQHLQEKSSQPRHPIFPQPPQQEEKEQQQQQQQQQDKESAEQVAREDVAALLLLPKQATLAVMHWAAGQSKRRLGSDNAVACGVTLAAHMLELTQVLGTADTAETVHPLDLTVADSSQQQQYDAGLATSEQHCSHRVSSEGGMTLQDWRLAGEDLDQALALVTKLIHRLSRLPAADAAAAAAGQLPSVDKSSSSTSSGESSSGGGGGGHGGNSSSSGGSSSSSSSSGGSSSTMLLPILAGFSPLSDAAPDRCHILVATSVLLMRLQVHVAASHSAELPASTSHSQHSAAQHGTAQLSTGSVCWARHLLPMLRITETTVRLLASWGVSHYAYLLTRPLFASTPDGLAAAYRDDPYQGLDSPAALSLFSICCSLLKALGATGPGRSAAAALTPARADAEQLLLSTVLDLCDISIHKASHSVPLIDEGPSLLGACSSTGDEAASTPDMETPPEAAGRSSSGSGDNPEVISLLPWLVLLGRCCLNVALELQQPFDAASVDATYEARALMSENLGDSLCACVGWLQDGSNAAQLAAAGYKRAVSSVLLAAGAQQEPATPPGTISAADPDDTCAAVSSTADAGPDADDAMWLAAAADPAWAQQLQNLGLSLNTLAISCACNNPYCSSTEGLCELQLVEGRARLCAKCRVARYCSRECQAQHWKLHKLACKELEAARQAQGSTGPPAAAAAAASGCLE